MRTLGLALLVVGLGACAGDDGINGENGAMGARGPAGPRGESGQQGPAGNAGPMGAPGRDGKDAAASSYRPHAFVGCSVVLDLVASGGLGMDGVTETYFDYSVIEFSNGDLSVACEAGLGAAESASDGSYYPVVVNGATTAACITSVDYPPYVTGPSGHVGEWIFRIGAAGPEATYRDDDSGHPLDGDTYRFIENDCNVWLMSDAGEWADAALSDVF